MASIITGVIIWILTAFVVLSFFGTVIIASIIDEQAHEEPIALALKAGAIVTTPLSIWVYGYLLKKKIDKKKEIELERKVKELVGSLPKDIKNVLGFREEIDETKFKYNLSKGLQRYGVNNYHWVVLNISNYEIEVLDRLSKRYFNNIYKTYESAREEIKEWHDMRTKIKEVFEKYRKTVGMYYKTVGMYYEIDEATRD